MDFKAHSPALSLFLVLLLSLLAAWPLLVGPGIVNTRAGGDSPFLLQRVQQLTENLRAGLVPARWMPDGAYGLGYPFYDFYAAAPYYLAATLNWAGFGVLWSIKLTQALGFVLAGLMTYALARQLGASRGAAIAASAVYTFAPFHLVNVYVRGDSLSELYALALYPLILWALGAVCERPTSARIALLAGSYGLLLLTHNISALIFSPLVGLWLVAQALAPARPPGARTRPGDARDRGGWRTLAYGALALGLGLMLSAWFWLPALGERDLVQLQEQTTGFFHYAGHFRVANLVQWRVLHDYAIAPRRDPFSMGLLQALCALAGLGALSARVVRRRGLQPWHALAALALLGYTWLITPGSGWVWAHVPLLPYVQFPWRLLGVQALLISLVIVTLPDLWTGHAAQGISLALAMLAAVTGLAGLRVDRLPLHEADITPERLMLYETYSGNIGSTIRYEYLPREMVPRPYTSAVQLNGGVKPTPLALEGTLRAASLLGRTPDAETWDLDLATPALLAFQTTSYPGWQARVDDQAQPVEQLPGLGTVGLRVPAGTHRVSLRLGLTPMRRYASWASLGGLLGWLALALYPVARRFKASARLEFRTAARRLHREADSLLAAVRNSKTSLLAGVVCLTVLGPLVTLATAPSSDLRRGPLVMDFERAPYLHEEPGGVFLGPALLRGYALSATQVRPGDGVRLALAWQQATPDLQVRVDLVGATAHLWEPAPVWATISAPIASEQVLLELALPAEIPPGLYLPRLTVLKGGMPQRAHSLKGWSMGTLSLQPLQVMEGRRATGRERVLASFGPENRPPAVSLVGLEATRPRTGVVEVALTWRSERQAPLNYYLSLRLSHAGGDNVVSRDLPPLLGGYPTSLWRPGELITDRVLLAAPEDELPAGQYALEIVLYDRSTLKGAGLARVQGISLP